jgi:hypothetical protein
MNNIKSPHSASCAELMIMAEHELAAFLGAVTKLYGAEQTESSAEVWLAELSTRNGLPGASSRDWRAVTIAALARLANQLTTTEVSIIPSPSCCAAAHLM